MEFTLKEIKPILKYIIENNQKLQDNGQMPLAVNLQGEAGLGKTLSIKQLAQELGANFVKINTSTVQEPAEFIGFPVREHYVCKHDPNNPENDDCTWIASELLEAYAKMGYKLTDETRMGYAIPAWLKEFKEGEMNILLLDDWTRKK